MMFCSCAALETDTAIGFSGRNGEYQYFRFYKSNETIAIVVNKINALAADPDLFVCAAPFVVGTSTCPLQETYLVAHVCSALCIKFINILLYYRNFKSVASVFRSLCVYCCIFQQAGDDALVVSSTIVGDVFIAVEPYSKGSFQLSISNATSTMCPASCRSCVPKTNICFSCLDGQYLNGLGSCSSCTPGCGTSCKIGGSVCHGMIECILSRHAALNPMYFVFLVRATLLLCIHGLLLLLSRGAHVLVRILFCWCRVL